jgi:hypothetical protein
MPGLRDELLIDPLARGYAGMTDQEAADDLNLIYPVDPRTRNRTNMTGDEVFLSLESLLVWDQLTSDKRLEFLALCGRESIDPFGSANVDVVISIFGLPSAGNTTANLQASRVEDITRSEELPGVVSPARDTIVRSARAS